MENNEITIEVSERDGTASSDWWTEETDEILSSLGAPAPGYETVNRNRWCG